MNARTRYLLTLSGLLALSVCLHQTIGQQQKPRAGSAEKIRQLIREIREAKTEEQRWCLAIRGVQIFEQGVDTPAAVALLEEVVDVLEKTDDNEPSPLHIGPSHLYGAINSELFSVRGNFVVSLLPLLEEGRNDTVARVALGLVVDYCLSGYDRRMDDWLAKYLRKGQLPPMGFIDEIFKEDPDKALWKVLRAVDEDPWPLGDVLPKEALAYLQLCQHSIRLTDQLYFRVEHLDKDWPDEVRREFRKSFQAEKERAKKIIVQTWQLCPQWYVRRYIAQWVSKHPGLFLTPEIMKLMRQENHPTIRPLVNKLEEIYQRLFPNNP